MKEVTSYFIGLLLLALWSCSENEERFSSLVEADSINLRADLAPRVEQDNSFAFEFFKSVTRSTESPNVLVAPFSVSLALNMVLNGARGETLEEMEKVLRISGFSPEEINEYSKALTEAILKADPSANIDMKSSIWYRLGFPIGNYFIQTGREFYGAEVSEVDFFEGKTTSRINQWVEDNANGSTGNVINGVPSKAIMYLINTAYFKGMWKTAFDKSATSKEDFYSEKDLQHIPMMKQQANFNCFMDENAAYLELPYGNNAFSMIVVLPDDESSMEDVINQLNRELWNNVISGFNNTSVSLKLPRFKSEAGYALEEKILPEMGMNLPFSSLGANFTGIYKAGGIHISEMIHKAVVSVDEDGIEELFFKGLPDNVQPQVNFHVNKPFLFIIKENSTGIILFMGKIGVIAC